MVKDSSSRQIVDLAFNREGLVSNVAYETTYGTSVAGMAQAGLGVGILPESMAAPSRLHQLRIRGEALTRRISIIMRAGRSLSPTADKLGTGARNRRAERQQTVNANTRRALAIRSHRTRRRFRCCNGVFAAVVVLLAGITLSGCELAGGIFKAGMAVGIFIVLAFVALVVFLVSKFAAGSEGPRDWCSARRRA